MIHVKGLSVRHGSRTVLDSLNVRVQPGEFVSVVGKSGMGKTTLLNSLCGFVPHDGEMAVPGKMSFVFQNNSVFPWMTVKQHICLASQKKTDEEFPLLFGLEQHKNKYPAQLSGGERQRLAVASAFATDASVVLMDEPFGSLDMLTRERMQNWLHSVHAATQKTILFVTHSIEEALFLSDRVLVLQNPALLQEFVVDIPKPRTQDIKYTAQFMTLKKEISECL